MAISHAKSNTLADFTGTATVYNSAGATTTVAATDLIRPSDWNSGHNQFYTLQGNTNNASTASGQNVALSAGHGMVLIGSNSQIGFSVGTLSASQVSISGIGTPSYTNLQAIHDLTRSAGHLNGGAITDATGGSVNVAAGSGFIRIANDDTSTLLTFNWPAPSALAVPSDTIRYVVCEYNGGTPQVVLYTSESYDYRTSFPLGIVVNEGGTLYINDTPHNVGRIAGRVGRRNYEVDGRSRAHALGGLIISESGTAKTLAVTAGATWLRGTREVFSAFDSNGASRFDRYYRNGGGGWTREATQSVVPDGLWDNGTGTLATISTNNYCNYWFYLGPSGAIVMVYGRFEHNSASAAQAGQPPGDLPLRLQVGGLLLGRFTVRRTGGPTYSVTAVNSAFSYAFTPIPVSDHGSLGGLNADDHTQYALRSQGVVNSLSAGTTRMSTGEAVFSNSNGVTFGLNGNTVTASHNGLTTAAQSNHSHGNPTLALTNISGTTASNSAGLTLSLAAAAPGGGVTLSYFNPQDAFMQVAGVQGQGTLHIQPGAFPDVQFDRIVFPIYYSGSSNSTATVSVTQGIGFYTRNASTLNLLFSTTSLFTIDHSGAGSTASVNGIRLWTIPFTTTLPESQYWVGILHRTSTSSHNVTISQILASQMNTNFSGLFGVASNATDQYTRGLGHYSASTAIPPDSIAFSQIRGTASLALRQPIFYVVSGTI